VGKHYSHQFYDIQFNHIKEIILVEEKVIILDKVKIENIFKKFIINEDHLEIDHDNNEYLNMLIGRFNSNLKDYLFTENQLNIIKEDGYSILVDENNSHNKDKDKALQ